jgi:hypothetical protein
VSLLDVERVFRFFAIPGVVKVAPGKEVTFRDEDSGAFVTLRGQEGGGTEVVDSSFLNKIKGGRG